MLYGSILLHDFCHIKILVLTGFLISSSFAHLKQTISAFFSHVMIVVGGNSAGPGAFKFQNCYFMHFCCTPLVI